MFLILFTGFTLFSVREGLRRGTQDLTAADLPSFLWPDGAFYTEDAYNGFLRSALLVTVCPFLPLPVFRCVLMPFFRHTNISSYPRVLQERPTSRRVVETLRYIILLLSHTNQSHTSQQW